METKEQKEFYVTVNGQKVEVSEEVYRAYVRPVRAQQRTEKRNRRCKVKGARLGLVRCKGNCSECEYAKVERPLAVRSSLWMRLQNRDLNSRPNLILR